MAKTPDITAEKLARVAELHYVYNSSREKIIAELSQDLLEREEGYDLSNVNVWLTQAAKKHVIAFDIDPSFAIVGNRNEILERRLNHAFGLEEPIVVDVEETALQDPKAADLHTALANQTGMRLSQIPSSKTRFFVAGGRTVVHVARMIKRHRLLWSNIRIDPLSGRNWTGYWHVDGPDLERPLDADDATVILASAFPKGATFSQIGHPLYAENADQARAIMGEHCAFLPDGGWNWDREIPYPTRRGICGIGSLHPESGHRIMSFLETYLKNYGVKGPEDLRRMIEDGTLARIKLPESPDRSAPYLSRVALELIAAITFAAERDLGYFGDIANRLYPCLPLPKALDEGDLPEVKDYGELVTKLNALNSRAVVMQWSHLRNVDAWVTAGGTLKLEPIWTLAITRYIEQRLSSAPNREESILTQLT